MGHSRLRLGLTAGILALALGPSSAPASAEPSVKGASPASIRLEPGKKATVTVAGSDLMAVKGAEVLKGRRPARGVRAELARKGASDTSRRLTLEASRDARPGRYSLQLLGPRGPIRLKVALEVIVAPSARRSADQKSTARKANGAAALARKLGQQANEKAAEAKEAATEAARKRGEGLKSKAPQGRKQADLQQQQRRGDLLPGAGSRLERPPTLAEALEQRRQARKGREPVSKLHPLKPISPDRRRAANGDAGVIGKNPAPIKPGGSPVVIGKKPPGSKPGGGGLGSSSGGGGMMSAMNHGAQDAGPNDCATCHSPEFETYPALWNWITFQGDSTPRFVKLRKPDEDGGRFKALDANGNQVTLIADVDAVFSSSNPAVVAIQGPASEDPTHITQGIQAVGTGTATITGVLRLHYSAARGGGVEEVPAATHSVSVVGCATAIASFELVPNPVCPNANATANLVLDGAACEANQLYVQLRRTSGNTQVATNLSQDQNTPYLAQGTESLSYTVQNGEHGFDHTVEAIVRARLMTSQDPPPPGVYGGQLDLATSTLELYPSASEACAGAPSPGAATPANFSDTLYDIFQNAKCTNCHGLVNKNQKFNDHVSQNRFDASITATTAPAQVEAYVSDESNCVGCHSGSAWAPHWHAPPAAMDFSGAGAASTCQTSTDLASAGIVAHLQNDALILWAIDRISGVNQSDWFGDILDWQEGGLECQ